MLHFGLAFRYSRWQHTALWQAAAVAAAATQTAWGGVCDASRGATSPGMRRLAAFLTSCHTMPLPWEEPSGWDEPHRADVTEEAAPTKGGAYSATERRAGSAGSCRSDAGGSGTPPSPAGLDVPGSLDVCRLLLNWSQVGTLCTLCTL